MQRGSEWANGLNGIIVTRRDKTIQSQDERAAIWEDRIFKKD